MVDLFPRVRKRLPNGRQFALTWGIRDDFGGMTSAMLHRSRALVRLGGRPVDVLTFDARPDYPALGDRLREAGELTAGMRLFNLYDWFREYGTPPDTAGTPFLRDHAFTPLDAGGAHGSALRGRRVMHRTRRADDGTVLQTDHYREDGSLLLSDRRDTRTRGQLGGRSVVLCDGAGRPVRAWGSIWSFYRLWLDLVRNREPSFLVVDSKPVARFMLTYRRRRAVTLHVVHNSHLNGVERPSGRIKESRRPVFEHLDRFDAVVLLTPRQKADVEALLGPSPNLCTVPNSRDLAPRRRSRRERPRGRGVVIASLTPRKRVDHAVRAVAVAAERAGGGVTLDVFGSGGERGALRKLVGRLEAADRVRLLGHRPDAREQLAAASFVLLTGRTEGFPLVLIEAMSAGCLPVAYDVPYGPADVITHGRNGFLVEQGNIGELTDTVVRLSRLPAREIARMRGEARRTARRYSDAAVTRVWAREMRRAQQRHRKVFQAASPAAAPHGTSVAAPT
ncbi:glycosyltransferase [Streptomyces ovatisporus]|uniref:D-inositol 3-phosphate glycosyltransferase n=1 Tax=Streptomyces ovatisporus TaxID=1128682 RepID=A0ABV9A8B8_9ACTN